MNRPPSLQPSRHAAIEDNALDWLIRREDPDWCEGDQLEFETWLGESMANRAAYLRAAHGWVEAERVKSLGAWGELRDDVSYRSMGRWWSRAIAASLIAAAGLGAYYVAPQFTPQLQGQEARFNTPVGGRKVINLADGSRVELNTQSAVRASINDKTRDVWLDSGEVYFEVMHREGEPFVVHAGKRTITVLGTKFSVRRDGDRVTVNVVEGRVRLDGAHDKDTSAAIITAGDTVITRQGSTLITPHSQERVQNALAWRDGMLTFDLVPLSEVAAEFNRYNRAQLVVEPSVARVMIGGTFQAANVDAFARLLHDAYGLKSNVDGDRVVISN